MDIDNKISHSEDILETGGFIKSALKANEQANSQTYELKKLKKYFPQYFDKNGDFDFDKFKIQLDKENVKYADEKFSQKENYALNFVGKKFAQILTGQEPLTVITPDLEHNNKPENINSENIYIKGDNFEALKHLINSYENKVKCIYIDPPYNTGSDNFAYPDNFKYNVKALMNLGLEKEEAERVENLYGKSSHSAWLTFMLPRLTLASDLLDDNGIIFISIDDNEQANLKKLCDEIFGEENFVTNFVWEKGKEGGNDSSLMRSHYDNVLCYSKSSSSEGIINLDSKDLSRHITSVKEPNLVKGIVEDKNEGELFQLINLSKQKDYTVTIPLIDGSVITWGSYAPQKSIDKWIQEGKVFVGEKRVPYIKSYLKDELQGQKPSNIITQEYGTTKSGSIEIRELLGSKEIFAYPKPSSLIKRLLSIGSREDSLVVDFFSGSASTAHAIMQLNAEDKGKRKFILVNIPEKLSPDKPSQKTAYEAGYRTICDIGTDRIKKAAKKIKQETNADIDYGFKIYELNTPNDSTLDKVLSFDETVNKIYPEDFREYFKFNGINGEDTILQTWKVYDGYGFNISHSEIFLNKMCGYLVKKTLYLINPSNDDFVKPLIEKLDNELKEVNKVVVFGYSYTLTQLQSLEINIKNFNDIKGQNDKVKVEVRY